MEKYKILIIEDEASLLEVLKIKFKKEGYNVYATNRGTNGIKLAKKKIPDLILLDIIMPKVDGFEVLKIIKQNPRTKDIPIIILTNSVYKEEMKKAFELGATDYLVKSNFSLDSIVKATKKRIEK